MSKFIKSKKDIEKMRESGKIAASILNELRDAAKPGISTKELDMLAEKLIEKHKVKPAFKGYDGFPGVVCTSVNDIIVHGIPTDEPLREGDILGLDFGVIYKGWYSDTAITIPIGDISHEARRLIRVTKKALRLGIKKAKPGNTTGDIGNTIQRYVEDEDYKIVKSLVGHGIGKKLHEDPQVPNWGKRHTGVVLEEGMVIAIEPMVIGGGSEVVELAPDKFSFKSKSGGLTAHFEHTIAITAEGPEILTVC
ncbi:MAG: type I methionyl aminopeptidase [Candidatus Spechtbacterales bacterium]|nr:type I methionyl aminopeptidase [Candidatus Spechtbacterales bacterium]